MPLYEYQCEKCNHHFELIQKFSDPPVTECPQCHGGVRKVISSPGIMFKGSGWYVTDYSNKLKNQSEEKKENSSKKEPVPADKKEAAKETSASSPTPAPSPKPSES